MAKYNFESRETTVQRKSIPYTVNINNLLSNNTLRNLLRISRRGNNNKICYDIILQSFNIDNRPETIEVKNIMYTLFEFTNPAYIKFIEYLLNIETDLDLKCEEKMLVGI